MSSPSVAGLPYEAQHAAALHVLAEVRLAHVVQMGHAYPGSRQEQGDDGRARILARHRPRAAATRIGVPLCERQCARWPCDDYRDAAAGLVTDLGPPGVPST